ncbi:MAG: hypothetical protein L6R36_008254 [Xanthoria steineri]|nr:MAG: hypothetical protein L6R36_008254 [Xanthoria steineri]
MSWLEKLPGEILSNVAGFAESEDLFNFRLVNRYISTSMEHVFLRRFFHHRNVFINNDSLEILRQVSTSEKHRASVTSLAVCIHHVPETEFDYELEFDLEYLSNEARAMVTSNHPLYAMLLRDQKWLVESGQAAASLALALGNFPNCTSVEVTDLLADVYRSFRKSTASQFLNTRMSLQASIDFVKQLLSTTIAAISVSGRVLHTFTISHVSEGISVQQLPRLSSSTLGHAFSKLRCLSLTLGLKYNDHRDGWEIRLFDFLKSFPLLKDLDLAFEPRLTTAQFSLIAQGLHIEGISTLQLGCMDCNYDDLAALIKLHQDTLHHITLDAIDLTGYRKPWRSILELIFDQTSINGIEFTYCMSADREVSFGAHFEKGQISIPASHHQFREDLEAVIGIL